MKFKDLKIGDTFDFINDSKVGYNSFFMRCTNQIGSINCEVYHVEKGE